MATANCVHPHAQLEQPGAHCEQWHGHHKAHWRVQCAVLSTPRTVCWCTCVHTSHLWLKSRLVCHSMSSMHAHLCLVPWVVSPHPSLYFFLQFLFQLYLMSIPAPDEISMEDPLCDSSLGSMVTLDYVTPLTGYEHKDMELTDADELNLATTSDIYFQNALDDTASFSNVPDVDDNELAEFLAVVVDRTGQPVEVRSNNDQFSCDIRNLKSAQSQFPLVTQPKRMISQTGRSAQERIAEERESSNAQSRTMLDEQRRTIIAECSEKVLHQELVAAQAEQDRKILQEELLRQQQDFREVHQQDLMNQKELQKFQKSTFDEFAQKKFIEDQKIIMELSGRLQELQNEVNCMNDSRDFRDAESICSGNSHVTSPPGLFPRHPPFEGLLKPAFISQRQTEEPPLSEMPVWTVSQRFSHLQWRRLFKELWGRPTTTADFGSSFWQVPYASNLCLLEDKIQDRGLYLFTISYGSDAVDQRSGVGWFSGRFEIFVIYSWYCNAEFWSTWCEDCFSPEQDHP